MSSKKIRTILITALLLLVFFLATAFLLTTLIRKPSVQRYFLAHLSKAIGCELLSERVGICFRGGIGISAYDLEARSLSGSERIVASSARIMLDGGELIRGRIVPTGVFLSRPRIELDVKKDRGPSESGQQSFIKDILLQRAAGLHTISATDGQVHIKNSAFDLQDLNLRVSQKRGDPVSLAVRLQGTVRSGEDRAPFHLRGTIHREDMAQGDSRADMTLKMGKFPLTWIPWPEVMHVKEGHAEAHVEFKAALDGPVSAEGKIVAEGLSFLIVEPEMTKGFSMSHLALDFESVYSEKVLQIRSLRANCPDFSLKGHSRLDFRDSSDTHLALRIEGPFMPLETFKRNFPTPLFSQWLEEGLFPILTGGEVRLDHFSLNGTLSEIENMYLSGDAKSLSMKLALRGIEVFKHEDVLPLQGVSGELVIENGRLLVSGVKAGFGRSTIKDTTIGISNLFGEAYEYDVSVSGSADVKDLLQQRNMILIPRCVREQFDSFVSASGNLEASFRVLHEDAWDNPQLLEGEFRFRDGSFVHKDLHLPVSLDEAGLKIDGEGQNRFWGKGRWGRSEFQASGLAGTSWDPVKAYVVGRADMNEIMGLICQGQEAPMKFSTMAPCRVSLVSRKDLWSCQGKVELAGVALETKSFSMDPVGNDDKIEFSLEFSPGEKAYLKDFVCYLGKSSIKLSGLYDPKDKDSFNLNVSADRVMMEDLGIRFKKTSGRASGMLNCQTQVTGLLRSSPGISITGKMEAQDLSLQFTDIPSPVNDCDFRLIFSGKKVLIPFLTAQIGHSPVFVQGHLRGWDELRGRLTIKADYLDDADFIPQGGGSWFGSEEPGKQGAFSQADINIKLDVVKGRWREMKYGPLEAECVYRSGTLDIQRSRIRVAHGILKVTGHVRGGREPKRLFSIYVMLADQPAQEFLEFLGVQEKYLEGRLAMEAVLFAKGRDTRGLISGLTGSANVQVEKGKINKSNLIVEILDFLSLQKIFQKRPPDLSKEGLYFESIKGHIAINEGVLETNDLIMKSPVFNAAAKGRLDLAREWIELDLGTQPLGTIDSVVSRIPTVTYILSGKKETVLIYYFRVEGPLSGYEVQYIPLKNLRENVIGFFKRLLFAPERMIEEMSGITEDRVKKGVPLQDMGLQEIGGQRELRRMP